MKRISIAIIAAMLTAAAAAQQQPITPPCTYTTVQMPNGKFMTCMVCGTFTSCQ